MNIDSETIWNFGSNIFANGLLAFVIHAIIVVIVAKIVLSILSKTFSKQPITVDPQHNLMIKYIDKTIRTIIYVVVVFSILTQIKIFEGISTVALSATSILAVGVSLAAQETFSNYISGFFIAMYHPFKVGDSVMLKEKDIAGRVSDITLRHTTLITAENTTIMIPNSTMNSAILENRQFGQSRYTKFESIGVAYDSDIPLVKRVINEALAEVDGIEDVRSQEEIKENWPMVTVRVESFQDSSVEVKFPIHVKQYSEYFNVSSQVREKILEKFQENHIEIPYPITTVITEK